MTSGCVFPASDLALSVTIVHGEPDFQRKSGGAFENWFSTQSGGIEELSSNMSLKSLLRELHKISGNALMLPFVKNSFPKRF